MKAYIFKIGDSPYYARRISQFKKYYEITLYTDVKVNAYILYGNFLNALKMKRMLEKGQRYLNKTEKKIHIEKLEAASEQF